MPTITQAAESSQPVEQQVNPPSGTDPTSSSVFVAFVAMPTYGAPTMPASGAAAWNPATWVTDTNPTAYYASCMVGPNNSGVVLTTGSYAIAVKVDDPAATPEMWGWTLVIT